jgi:hypothetical protein
MRRPLSLAFLISGLLTSCEWLEEHKGYEKITAFTKIGEIALTGGATAAEISAFDPETNRLFVVNAVKSGIDVIDMSNPFNLVFDREISILDYGAGVNSVSVNNGLLAAAIESDPKTSPGKVVIWNTTDLSVKGVVTVGALPDMVTFSPNGKYIVSANEGEPNEDYTLDPKGTISIIRLPGLNVSNLDFSSFSAEANFLKSKGFRTPGPEGTAFAEDVEPEYVAVSHDSRTAWVTLQENNAIAKIDLHSSRIEEIFPLGFLDHNLGQNAIDASDNDDEIGVHKQWPVKGMYLPDGISAFTSFGTTFIITANEGDSRIRPTDDNILPPPNDEEGDIFNEEDRIEDVVLDPTKFPDAAIQDDDKLGRLKITNTLGDVDGDEDYDELYSFGTRSFTIRNGSSGKIVYESGKKLEEFLLEKEPSFYDDGRSDDKGVEPESVTTGKIGPRTLAFVALERADALVVVDVTQPSSPVYLQVLHTGDAPEGVLFIPKHESPIHKSLVVTSCEGDGTVQVFTLTGEETDL